VIDASICHPKFDRRLSIYQYRLVISSRPLPAVHRVVVSTCDLEGSLRFYRDAIGLEGPASAAGIARLHAAGAEVMLHERAAAPSDTAVAAAFAVGDLDRVVERCLAASGALIDAPADQPWGERQAVLRDPDGHVVCLVQATPTVQVE
jgi:predicted enzyme related to lactoylglutathione lyase